MGGLTRRHSGRRRHAQGRRRATRFAALASVVIAAATIVTACGSTDSLDSASDASAGSDSISDTQAPDRRLSSCARPYSDDSAWNTPIGENPVYHERSATFVRGIESPLTSDPTQFTYPIYEVSSETPRSTVYLEGWFSNVQAGGTLLENQRAGSVELPIPIGAKPSDGFDAQIVMLDPETGDEWGASVLSENADGTFNAWNTYHYNTAWSALTPYDDENRPIWSRGASIPYLAGLVRPCEIEQGLIDHAIAFSYDSPRNAFVRPATKSDGDSGSLDDLPEGARVQLDPTLTELEIKSWECTGACFAVARALQDYGMIVVDNSGRSKLYFEFQGPANWNESVEQYTVSPIPVDHLLVLDFEQPTPDD